MKIVFGCDPNATEFKLQLMEYVKGLGHEVADLGSDDPIYANTAIEVAKAVAAKEYWCFYCSKQSKRSLCCMYS